MPIVTLAEESKRKEIAGFRIPEFEVRIEGVGLPRDALRDVIQLTYHDSIDEIGGFELTVYNWDTSTNTFKYVGSETAASLQGDTPDSRRYRLFEPSSRPVLVRMGYADEMRVMLTGTFTTMEPTFPSSGAPTLTVRGLNVLHKLRTKPYTYAWRDMKDSQIAQHIATLTDPQTGRKRFPLPIVIDTNAQNAEPVLRYVAQENQHDIDFLMGRARERGYVIFIQERDPHVRGSMHRLYFGPSHADGPPGLRDVTFELEWGKALIEFKPTLTTTNQMQSVTVRGWNRQTKQQIHETVDLNDRRINRNRDLHDLVQHTDARDDIVVHEPVVDRRQARERAVAILDDRQKQMVTASITTVGLPALRAGQRVLITGVGARFGGTYFVTDTTHTIGDSGYTTRFNARREDAGRGSAP